jgi:hypothetical protein
MGRGSVTKRQVRDLTAIINILFRSLGDWRY